MCNMGAVHIYGLKSKHEYQKNGYSIHISRYRKGGCLLCAEKIQVPIIHVREVCVYEHDP